MTPWAKFKDRSVHADINGREKPDLVLAEELDIPEKIMHPARRNREGIALVTNRSQVPK